MNAPIQAQPDRTKFIGGSDVAAILGISPWRSAVDLWLDKITPRVENGQNAAAKRRGSRLEPYIRDMIQEEHGLKIVRMNQRYIDTDIRFLAAEIDAETDEENIEIKTVHPFKAKEWGEHETDQLPIHYVAQAQHGLGVTGRKVCRVFALIGDELKPYVVERDDELIEVMRTKSAEFWNRYVLPKVQPPIDFQHKDVMETLKRMYPGTDGTVIEADVMHEHWRAVYETASEMVKKYEGIVDGAKAHLLFEMGNACAIRFSDDRAFSRKIIKKKAYRVEHKASQYVDFRFAKFKEQGEEK
jgi:putative phage-type endonuclease